jgi:hypothetical protein
MKLQAKIGCGPVFYRTTGIDLEFAEGKPVEVEEGLGQQLIATISQLELVADNPDQNETVS